MPWPAISAPIVSSTGAPHSTGLAHHGHEPAHRLHEHVHAGLVAPGPLGAECGERTVDETGIEGRQPLPVDAEALGNATAVGLDHDVGARHQPLEGGAALRPRQVESHASLVAVDRHEDRALAAELAAIGCAGGIAAGRLFDLHDVGTHVGQVHAAGGPGDEVRQLEDAIAGERQDGHGTPTLVHRLFR